MAMENVESTKVTIFGFENKQDLLDEINFRYKLINKCNILLKKIPTQLTRIAMKDLIPEMTSCRYPEKTTKKANYAFIQFANDALVDKYIDLLNKKQLYGKHMIASKLKSDTTFTDVNIFDLKKLYFNGLKPETKYYEIKEIFTNAKVNLPVHEDKSCCGYVTLTFESEEEAMNVFMENKLTLHGVKCHLIFLIKSHQKKSTTEEMTETVAEVVNKVSPFEKPEEMLEEIKARFESQNNRTVMIKNLPIKFTLSDLKKLVPSMRNCKINMEKNLGFIEFDNVDLASKSVKEINGKIVDGRKVRAFVAKKATPFTSLSSFNLSKLHLTNLSMDTSTSDIATLFPDCQIECPLNTDNTCIGNATLTFVNEANALKSFSKTGLQIRNVDVDINYHIESKSNEVKPVESNNKKRQLSTSDDDETKEVVKKTKVSETESKPVMRKSLMPVKKAVNRKSDEKKDSVDITKEVVISIAPLMINENANVQEDIKKPVIKRKESMIPKSAPKKVEPVKKIELIEKPIKQALPVEKKTKQVPSKVLPKKTMKVEEAEKKTEKKPVQPAKRKFVDVEEETIQTPVKKSRVIAKPAVTNGAKMNLRSKK